MIGSTNYALLSNLVSPSKPKDNSFTQLAEVLHGPFDPKPLVIVEDSIFIDVSKLLVKILVTMSLNSDDWPLTVILGATWIRH